MPNINICQIEDKKGENRHFGVPLPARVRGGGLTELCTASAVAIPVLAGNQIKMTSFAKLFYKQNSAVARAVRCLPEVWLYLSIS